MTTGHSTRYGGGGGGGGAPSGLGSTAVSGLQQVVPGVAVTPGWTVVGDYFYIKGKVSLEFIALPSNSGITCRAKLFDPVANADVAGSILTIGPGVTADTRAITGDVSAGMPVNRIYQIQVEATGGATQSDFCTMREARVLES
jgi:hypothetical protein